MEEVRHKVHAITTSKCAKAYPKACSASGQFKDFQKVSA